MIRTFLFLLLSMPILTFSQIAPEINGTIDELNFSLNKSRDIIAEEVDGSPYLNEAFVPAKISNITKTQLIRFNVVENRIEVQVDDEKIKYLSLTQNYLIKLMDASQKEYVTASYIDEDGKTSTTFFEKIYADDKFRLYKKEGIKYIPRKKAASSYEQDVPARLHRLKDDYYTTDFLNSTQKLIKVPEKKKNLAGFFGNKSKEIGKLMKKEKLKLDKGEDLISILKIYFQD